MHSFANFSEALVAASPVAASASGGVATVAQPTIVVPRLCDYSKQPLSLSEDSQKQVGLTDGHKSRNCFEMGTTATLEHNKGQISAHTFGIKGQTSAHALQSARVPTSHKSTLCEIVCSLCGLASCWGKWGSSFGCRHADLP
jgi:hypothetical protein